MWSAVLAVFVSLCPRCSVCSCSCFLRPLASGLSGLSGLWLSDGLLDACVCALSEPRRLSGVSSRPVKVGAAGTRLAFWNAGTGLGFFPKELLEDPALSDWLDLLLLTYQDSFSLDCPGPRGLRQRNFFFFSAPAGGGLFKGPARRACPVVVCGQGGCLSPLLRGWWPKVVVAPPVLPLSDP